MLIIEGADNLGKTTAAKTLVKMAGQHADHFASDDEHIVRPVRYVHMSRPNSAFDFFRDYQDMLSLNAVQDRFHLGALVWHTDVLDLHRLRIIEGWLASLGSYMVIFYCECDDFYRAWLEQHGKEEMFDVDTIVAANAIYREIVYRQHHLDPRFDQSFAMTEEQMFPDDKTIQGWLESWFQRMQWVTT
jgi:hypothetical protein